jgi:hypothetical protein
MGAKKVFFSVEKKQKTFASLSRFYPAACAEETRVFWFFFSKKELLKSSLFLPTGGSRSPAQSPQPPRTPCDGDR